MSCRIKSLQNNKLVDPCTVDTLRAGYLVLPSFQVSPEITIGLTTDTTIDFSGDLQVDKLTTIVHLSW